MKKALSSLFILSFSLLASLPAAAQGTYQLKNADFEEWESVTYSKISGDEPKYWNSFLTADGSKKAVGVKANQLLKSEDVHSGSTGKYSAKIIDYDVKMATIHLAYANGNLTTGQINMGSTKASDAAGNYNFTNTSDDDFNQKFTGLPDAMKVWVKYYSSKSSYRAKATTILHTSGYYQDPYYNQNNIVKAVATATNEAIEPNNTWTELTIPFTYSITDGTRPAYALVSFSTNATPGTGTGSDYMLIDDLEYVYYHTLSALSYNGTSLLNGEQTAYDLSDQEYDKDKLAYAKKAVGGSVETAYDDDSAVLTITVKGDNYEVDNTSVTTYTIQFKKAAKATVVKTTNYDETLVVTVNGQSSDAISAKIKVDHMSDGTINFSLKNFYLPGETEDENMYVGTIVLNGVSVKQEDGYESISTDQTITIEEGDDPSDATWFGPYLGEIPVKLSGKLTDEKLYTDIDIDMQESLNQTINVWVGADFNPVEIGTAADVNCEAGRAWVKFNRSFKKGWNTMVLPFATTAEELGAEEVASLASQSDNTVHFDVDETGAVEANKPYLVYFGEAKQVSLNKLAVIAATSDVQTVTPDGCSLSFVGNYTAKKALSSSSDNYMCLVNSNGASSIRPVGTNVTVPATGGYFTAASANSVSALSVAFDGSNVTGIDNALVIDENGLHNATGVYNLQGVKLSNGSTQGLPARLYIVNGKKLFVK